jgi:RsiW-degrading membrane proteinase PrsW (M82 family)
MNSKPKHAGFGIALGAALGAVMGAIAGHVGVWLAVGVAIGVAVGASLRRKGTECWHARSSTVRMTEGRKATS